MLAFGPYEDRDLEAAMEFVGTKDEKELRFSAEHFFSSSYRQPPVQGR